MWRVRWFFWNFSQSSLGFVSDVVVGQGGSAILSEFPELNGVEQD